MSKQIEQPFAVVLAALFNEEEPPIHLLFRLSDMSPMDFDHFRREWPKVGEERRVTLTRHLTDLAEDNYMVQFAPVFAYLFNDPSPYVRAAALDGVWDSEDLALVSPILTLLRADTNVDVKAAAARALAHYIILAEWGQIGDNKVDVIVDALLTEYDNPRAPLEVKRATLEAVSAAVHPRIPDLINDAYEEGSDELQLSAIFAMGVSADERWLPILEQELRSPSPDFRAEAARACGVIGSEDSIDLLEELVDDDDLEVGIAAIYALAQIGGDEAFAILNRLADDPAYEDYYEAIEEALDEIEWMDGGLDMLNIADDEDADEGDILDDLRLN